MRHVALRALLSLIGCSPALAQVTLTPVWRTDGLDPATSYGFAIAGVGDLDGDGFADLAIGEPFDDIDAATQRSHLRVFRGGRSGPGTPPDFFWTENANFFQLGYSVAGADVNGDGFADLLAGSGKRVVRAYHGSPGGPSATPNWTFTAPDGGTFTEVANAGDVNNDGFDDVVIGVPQCGRGQSREGCAYLYLGSAQGLSATPAWTAESNQADAEFGRGIAGVGDVNGDGFDDVVVGAPYFNIAGFDDGRIWLFLGGPSGLAATAAGTIDGSQAGETFGNAVAPAGDGNGDGRADVLVGAPRHRGVGYSSGRAVVFAGTATGWSSAPIWEVRGTEADQELGHDVASVGDFDGDGFGDLVVGAPNCGYGPSRVFVHRGVSGGWETSPAFVAVDPSQPGCFGYAVDAAGDVNGDGRGELVVGDPTNARVWLYSSRTTPASTIAADAAVAPLTVTLESQRRWLDLAWGGACVGEDDYNVYEGTLGDFTSHVPIACGTNHATTLGGVPLGSGSTYYLVVPRGLGSEGSYGHGRLPGFGACAPQEIAGCR